MTLTVGIPGNGTGLATEDSGLSLARAGLEEARAGLEEARAGLDEAEVEVAEAAPRGVDLGGRARLRLTRRRGSISVQTQATESAEEAHMHERWALLRGSLLLLLILLLVPPLSNRLPSSSSKWRAPGTSSNLRASRRALAATCNVR